jgi:hypothetical protein
MIQYRGMVKEVLWIHGRTHVPCDYKLFGTRVVCNPKGYPSERQRGGFQKALSFKNRDEAENQVSG